MQVCTRVIREYYASVCICVQMCIQNIRVNACGVSVATPLCQPHIGRQEDLKWVKEKMKTDGWEGELAWALTCTLHAQFWPTLFSSLFSFLLCLLLFAPFSVIPFHVAQGTNKSKEGLPPDSTTDSYLSVSYCPSELSRSLSLSKSHCHSLD